MGRRIALNLTIAQVQCVRELCLSALGNERVHGALGNERVDGAAPVSPELRERCAGVVREADRALAFDDRTTDADGKRRRAQTRTRSDP